MAEPPQSDVIHDEFRQALVDCQQLYHSAAQQCVEHHPAAVGDSPQAFFELMEDLGKGLVMKIYSAVAQADRRWSRQEAQLAEIVFEILWKQRLSGDALREATLQIFEQGDRLRCSASSGRSSRSPSLASELTSWRRSPCGWPT